MSDFQRFAEQVREVLAHYHDLPYLLAHPLTSLLTVGPGDADRVEQLRRTLVEAIGELRGDSAAQPGSRVWRGYRILARRYVDGASTEDLTRDLAITDRQLRRDQHEALEAVAGVLWARYQRLRTERIQDARLSGEAAPTSEDALLEAELLKIGAARAEALTDAIAVIRGALATAGPLAERRGLQLRATFGSGVPPVTVNRAALRHICLGILSYAIERSPEDVGVQSPGEGAPGGAVVALQVSLAAHAERGSDAEAEADPRLLVPRRLARLQGGSLVVEREASRLTLRLVLPGAALVPVLVIDDDPDVVRLFRRLVAGHPYQLHQANTGDRALELARQVRPAAILLDVMMLTQDGWEVLGQLKQDPELSRVPVVVCSVLHERALAEALGAAEFLHKPVSQQGLLAALERCRLAS